MGWVFEYALIDTSGKHSLAELRSVQDWFLRYQLRAVPGVAEVAPLDGFVRQYQRYPLFKRILDQRFIAELADPEVRPLLEFRAKLRHALRGSEGTLLIGGGRIVYRSKAPEESPTQRFEDIDNIESPGPFDLAITTLERSGWSHAGPTEFRFQLKQALSEDRYNELWRKIYRSKRAAD